MRLQAYDFEIRHEPGKGNIADPLSRLPTIEKEPIPFDEETELHVNAVVSVTNLSALTLEEVKKCNLAAGFAQRSDKA